MPAAFRPRQVTSFFPHVPLENIRSFISTELVLSRVKEFLDGGEGDACVLYFFVDKGNNTCLRQETKQQIYVDGMINRCRGCHYRPALHSSRRALTSFTLGPR